MTGISGKKIAGEYAVKFVQEGMVLGLGTGSTVAYFLDALGVKCREGLSIQAVTTSNQTLERAKSLNIPIIDINKLTALDLTIDGADEIDGNKRMIKGGGGALLREKIVASMSKKMIVIVDEHKVVTQLGKFPLPLEIIPFAYKATIAELQELGFNGQLRTKEDGALYITDNQNYIFDIHFPHLCDNPEEINNQLLKVPGVLETGFFFGLADEVVIGFDNGKFEIRT